MRFWNTGIHRKSSSEKQKSLQGEMTLSYLSHVLIINRYIWLIYREDLVVFAL